ncbi:APC family permease [Micrococcus lylae]|uniref:APC family permease n=1 Tax=Micrococcus lylae TaxID=1273 RepID=UPI003EBE59C5
MSASHHTHYPATAEVEQVSLLNPGQVSGKGLQAGKVGLLGAVVIGVSVVAPAYTLTSGLGPTISTVGTHVPAILLLGFIPMLLVALGYRALNTRVPDSGTSFTWATHAFGPYVGWMGGWGLVAASVIVLSNLAAVAVDFTFLLLAHITGNEAIGELAGNLWVNIPLTVVYLALAGWVCHRGMEATKKLQYVLVAFQLVALGAFSIAALVHASRGDAFDPTPVSLDWFNPFTAGDFSLVAAGVSLSIFLFWGWDVTLTMNEETKDPEKTPGRAASLTVLVIIAVYVMCTLAVIAWAGIGTEGLGAGNPENQESIFAVLAGPVLGPFAVIMSSAILVSSLASLQSTMVSPARTLLAMGFYKAVPHRFARVSDRFNSPAYASWVCAACAAVFYVVTRLLSENALWDTITALGLMICFYYGITALACVWYFRREWFASVSNSLNTFVFPLLGGIVLLVMFGVTVVDSMDPGYGSGSSVLGVGTVFILGMGVLLLGVALMLFTRLRHPAYFRGETLPVTDSTRSIPVVRPDGDGPAA